jgi:hypothetical protein
MPLIHPKILQELVSKHSHELANNKNRERLKNLFQETLDLINSNKFEKEESEKVVFLIKMFEFIGYKHHQNLSFEKSTKYRGSIDGNLKEDSGDTTVAVEWKGADTKDLERSGKAGETPVDQLFRYMSETQAEFGLVGNFLEFRLYSWSKRKDHFQQFKLEELAKGEDLLDELIFLLKPETVLKGEKTKSQLQNLVDKSEAEQEQITKRFYNDYKQRRLNLFGHLIENNPVAEKLISPLLQNENQNDDLKIVATNHKIFLLEKSQKILDRLIFVMFCEDGFLISSGTVKNTYTQARNTILPTPTKIWDFFKGLFLAIDKGNDYPKINAFNGGLFAEDAELNSLIIKDSIWQDLIKLAEYDFQSDLNVNILGHIFEQSISDIEEIKSEIEGETTDKKKSKRKKDGIYYTPEYITDYIVSETVGRWLEDQKVPLVRGQAEGLGVVDSPLETIKVLDPAGGSGAFPNQVHNFLAKKHVQKANQDAIQGGLETFATIDETQIDKSILKNNIFMVDLQSESVEIAKLSLWLKTAKKDQKLNNLDSNIKCGNSLIDDPEIAEDLAFDWGKEFGGKNESEIDPTVKKL